MVRIAVYVVLVVLAIGAVVSGELAVALALGGAKALLVGAEYMELRQAHRAHALGVALGLAVLVIGLIGVGAAG